METRKVQISGGSTYIISLPKKWAVRNGIKNGSSLNMYEDQGDNLIISPEMISFKNRHIGEIRIKGTESPEALMRRLVGAYVSGVTQLDVVSKGEIPTALSRAVREFTRLVMGVEIVEERKDLLRLQDLIDPSDFSIRSGIKRMAYIAEQMIRDSLDGLRGNDPDLMEDVVLRDVEVDRISWLIHKEYNMINSSPRTSGRTSMLPNEVLNYLLASRAIERVADHANDMAKRLNGADFTASEAQLVKIFNEGNRAKKLFTDSVASLLSQDLKQADSVVDGSRDLKDRIDPMLKSVFKLPPDEAVLLAFILNSIDRIASYSGDIAKATLNKHSPPKR